MLPRLDNLQRITGWLDRRYKAHPTNERIKGLGVCLKTLERLHQAHRIDSNKYQRLSREIQTKLNEERGISAQKQSDQETTDTSKSLKPGSSTADPMSSTRKEPGEAPSTTSSKPKRKRRSSTKSPAKDQPSSTKRRKRQKSTKKAGTPSTDEETGSESKSEKTDSQSE